MSTESKTAQTNPVAQAADIGSASLNSCPKNFSILVCVYAASSKQEQTLDEIFAFVQAFHPETVRNSVQLQLWKLAMQGLLIKRVDLDSHFSLNLPIVKQWFYVLDRSKLHKNKIVELSNCTIIASIQIIN